jgi:hypothetical protein
MSEEDETESLSYQLVMSHIDALRHANEATKQK